MRLFLAVLALWAFAAGLPAVEDFETGTGPWTVQAPASGAVAWHRVVAPACVVPHSGAACLYFGRDGSCNYDDGQVKDASVVSAPVLLSDPATAFVSFWEQYQVESLDPACFDKLYLERSSDGVSWVSVADLSVGADPVGGSSTQGLASGGGVGGPVLWQYHRIGLSAFLGSTLYLRFRFVSGASLAGNNLCWPADATYDAFLGYALDDISFGDAEPPLDLAKTVSPPLAAPGATFTYALTALNTTGATATVTLWDSLPAGAVMAGSDAPSSLAGNVVTWAGFSLPAGLSQTVHLMLQVSPGLVPPVDWLNVASASSSVAPANVIQSNGTWARVRPPGLSVRKTADRSDVTSGYPVAFTITVENGTAVSQSVQVQEQLPVGFVLDPGSPSPGFNAGSAWTVALAPGDLRIFSLTGPMVGLDGQVLTNYVQLRQGATTVASASVSVTVHAPVQPHLTLDRLMPNPAPGSSGYFSYIQYTVNQDMPVFVDIYTIAGEAVRHLTADADGDKKGQHLLRWSLDNDAGRAVASGVYLVRVWSSASSDPTPQAFGYQAVLR